MKKRVITLLLSMALVVSMFGNGIIVSADDVSVIATEETATEKDEKKVRLFEKEVESNNISYSFKDGVLTVSGSGCVDDSYKKLCKKSKIVEVIIKPGVKAIGDLAFADCKKLTKVTIPDTVKEIGHYAFCCTKLSEITIPASVEKMGANCFDTSNKVKKITMPGHFQYIEEEYPDDYNEVIMNEADEIYFNSEFSTSNIHFFNATKIYTWKKDNTYKSYQGIVYTKNGKKLIMVPAGTIDLNIRNGCETISMNSLMYSYDVESMYFPYCNKLKTITIPESVKKIVDDVKYECPDYSVLENCKWKINSKKLTGTSIENLLKMVGKATKKTILTSSKYQIKKINGMYITKDGVLLCYEGKNANVTIPSNVKRIGRMAFSENKDIKKVKFTNKLREIGDWAFSGCENLSEITWGKKLTTVGKAAFEWTNLKKVKLPNSVKSWGEGCFSNSNVQEVTFSKTMKEIPEDMFIDTKIKKLVIPGNIKKIGKYAFLGNEKIKSVTFKKGVETIEEHAFEKCGTIESVVVSKSVKSIGEYAFLDTKIEELKLKGTNTILDNNAIYEVKKIVCDTTPDKYIGYFDIGMIDGSTGEISLYVARVEGVSGFEISFAKSDDFSDEIIKTAKNKSGDVTLVLPDGEYDNYRIRPYINVDGIKVYGQWREYNW